jgi:replicative DNA helicase
MQNSDSGLRGVPSLFYDLDNFTSGWQKSDLIILAARPGMGKTSFALQLARNAASKGYPAAVFSLEMSSRQLMNRLIVAESEIYSDKIKTGNLTEYDWDKINNSVSSLIKKELYIDDTPSLSVFELRAKARRLKEQKKIELIVIDYIQLMTVGNHTGNRETEISTISRSLKSIAKELDIPIIVLSQLNRSVETRAGDKRPMLSDLRESGAIEQDADMVLFIYRPEYYGIEGDSDIRGIAEVIIAKHREGSLGTLELQFKGEFTKFTNKITRHENTT